MDKQDTSRINISKIDFIENFEILFNIFQSYKEISILSKQDKPGTAEKIQLLIEEFEQQTPLDISPQTVKMFKAYIQYTLTKFKGEQLHFLVPTSPEDPLLSKNDGLEEISKQITETEKMLGSIEEQVYYLTRFLPPFRSEKVRVILKAISTLFKSIIRNDSSDIENSINYLHHITIGKDSILLVNEIGHKVRDIYNSLQDVSSGVQSDYIEPALLENMPDAVDKLSLVITRMEKAVNKTLDDAENLLDKNYQKGEENRKLLGNCKVIEEKLKALSQRGENTEEIDNILQNFQENIINQVQEKEVHLDTEKNIYFQIIESQSFQDLTGQTLKKIINFIEELQISLLSVLQKYSGKLPKGAGDLLLKSEETISVSPLIGTKTEDGTVLHGPQDNKEQPSVKQEDIDRMLAEFGF